jgi:hypothetical protein
MAKKKRNRPVETINKGVCSTNSQTENESIIVKFIKMIFKWQTILGIIAILTFGFVVYDHIDHKSKYEHLKNDISDKISLLKNTLTPDKIVVFNDSTGELKVIKDFQIKALEYCTLYESIESSKSLEEYKKMDLEEYKNMEMPLIVLIKDLKRLNYLQDLCGQITDDLFILKNIGVRYDIKEYQLIDERKIQELVYQANMKGKVIDGYVIPTEEEILKNKDFNKLFELYKDIQNDYDILNFDDKFLLLILDTNQLINNRIHKIVSQ